ncbi:MAG: GreA/GreB family elongation factor [Puniceicoccales bacterium]|jgi:transcription elongation GreA/GreB family factor|nr:GreA/GreB family elongation factor [Puniceicoccales bacterium]
MDNAIEAILRKHPVLECSKEKIEQMVDSAYCLHASWGLGKIQSYDEVSDRFAIDFEEGPKNHLMEPEFCIRKLEILHEQHLLVRFHRDPEGLRQQVKEDPIAVILQMLRENHQKEVVASEIERNFRSIVGVNTYRNWWNRTKKLIAEDARIRPVAGKANTFVVCEEPMSLVAELLQQFDLHRDSIGKITVVEKVLSLSDEYRRNIMCHFPVFIEALQVAIISDSRLPVGKKLWACFIRDGLLQMQGEDLEFIEPSSKSILLEAGNNLGQVVELLPTGYIDQFLNLVACAYPDEWEDRCAQLLKNSAGKFTNECVSFFVERGCAEAVAAYFMRWLRERTLKAPVLYWIIKNRYVRRFASVIGEHLIGVELLRAIFCAIDVEVLHSTGNRRILLAELLSEDHSLIQDLLKSASAEEARDLAQMLWISQGFNALTKKSLLARFIKAFPQVQSLVIKDVQKDATREGDFRKVTRESMEAKRKEYEDLVNRRIPQNKQAIQVAREHGDLRENSEYKMARQDQEMLMALKVQLEQDLARVQVVDLEEANSDVISIGSVVKLRHKDTQKIEEYCVLGVWDGDPEKNILSYESPLGQELIGKKVGQSVLRTVDDQAAEWTVEGIERWVDRVK